MIDSITLMTKRALVEPENDLVINYKSSRNRNITLNYTDGSFETDIGHVYYNHPDIYEVDFSWDCTYLKFSPGKVLSEYSINYPVITSADEFTSALDIVWETTQSDGLVLPDYNGNDISIINMDIARDITLTSPFEDYLPCLDTLVSPYKKRMKYKTTRYWHNNMNTLCIYDKKEECGHSSVPSNTVRIEYRLDKACKVKQKIGSKSVSHLINNWQLIEEVYSEELTRLFKPSLNVNEHTDEGSYFKSTKSPMKAYLEWKGFQQISEEMSLTEFESFMKAMDVDSSSYYRYRSKYIELTNTIPFGNSNTNKYAEFRQKLLE